MTEVLEGQTSLFAHDTWSGKTYQELSAATEGKTSGQSSKKRSASRSRKLPMCLCLTADGRWQDASTLLTVHGALLGDSTTLNTGERPNAANASRLSQILEAAPPQKYCLSAKACRGILNRAERREKALPEILRAALEAQATASRETA